MSGDAAAPRANQRARRGSVKQDASGRWSFVYDRQVSGRRQQVRRRGFPTRADALYALKRAKQSDGLIP